MKILAIETSCDETAVAVTEERRVLSSVVASQIDEHSLYGGVVPEIASRRHVESISQLYREALEQSEITAADIGAVAVTYAPGLIGALLVGISFAKSLAYTLDVPLIPVHHLRAHIAANYIEYPQLEPPFLSLVVSGGHSHLIQVKNYTEFKVLGRTMDDAAGECFDKTARVLGLGYPGGVYLDKIAEDGNDKAYTLPRPKVDGEFDFSFSGLKTAVMNTVNRANMTGETINVPDMAACVRTAVCDILIGKTLNCAKKHGYDKIVLAGGVSANSELRRRFLIEGRNNNIQIFIPPLELCGDNAAMVGVAAFYEHQAGKYAGMNLNGYASLAVDN